MLPALFTFPDMGLIHEELEKFAKELSRIDKKVEGGVAVVGPAAAYALVWEWGNARQTKKGPKTTLGINPDGSRVWLSIQAPKGYIRVLRPIFSRIIDQEIAKVKFKDLSANSLQKELSSAASRITERLAKIIAEHAPEDSGNLKSSIISLTQNQLVAYDLEKFEEEAEYIPTELELEN